MRHCISPHHRQRMLVGAVAAVLIAGVLALAACTSSPHGASGTPGGGMPTPTPTANGAGDVTNAAWRLTHMVVDGASYHLVAGRAPTLQFHAQDDTFSGSSGCNGYGGAYTLTGDVLRLGQMRQTLMACFPTSIMDQESAYMNALGRVTRLQMATDTLTLSSSDGAVQLTFQPIAS